MHVAKTKALISFAVTSKPICVFVFAYAKSRFSHNEAHKMHAEKKVQNHMSWQKYHLTHACVFVYCLQ